MASFNLFDLSDVARTLANGEFGFIGEAGNLDVDGDAITAEGDVTVTVRGRLAGSESAIEHSDGFLSLTVGKSGRIIGRNDTIDGATSGVTGASIENAGRIRSGEDAIDIRADGPVTIDNDGQLIGESDGIVTRSESSVTRIINGGSIVGNEDGGIDHLGGDSFILNRGTIEGVAYGYDAADVDDGPGVDEVRNFGSIEGGVFLYALNDFVLNRGKIDFVELGGGNDIYVGRAEGSAGSVDGGGGRDVLVGSRADDAFTGGLAGDLFVFGRRGGDDRIEDFGGRDRIDLSDFGLSGFSELRPLIEDRADGALIDLSDRGLTILLVDVDKADLRGNDFQFELMVS